MTADPNPPVKSAEEIRTKLVTADLADPTEEWRQIPFAAGYEASNLGRVRSVDRVKEYINRFGGLSKRWYRGQVLAPNRCLYLGSHEDGDLITSTLQRAVYSTWVGEIPNGYEVGHRSDDFADDRPCNLVAAPRAELREYNPSPGEKNGRAKLTAAQVQEIRQSKGQCPAVAKQFGISKATVFRIRNGSGWKHLHVPA